MNMIRICHDHRPTHSKEESHNTDGHSTASKQLSLPRRVIANINGYEVLHYKTRTKQKSHKHQVQEKQCIENK